MAFWIPEDRETKPAVGITLIAVRLWLSFGNAETNLTELRVKMKCVSFYLTAVVLVCICLFGWMITWMTLWFMHHVNSVSRIS